MTGARRLGRVRRLVVKVGSGLVTTQGVGASAARIAGSSEAAEDIVHDGFARLVEKGIAFPSLDDAKFWLIRVVKNGDEAKVSINAICF